MGICHVGGVMRKAAGDKQAFKIDWSDMMDLGIGRTMPVVDRIESSSWAIAADSPSSTVTTPEHDFDPVSAVAWVSVDGGSEGDVIYLNNTIETTGASVNGKSTPPQRFERQLRIRIEGC